MSASANDLVRNAAPNFATTLSAPIVGSSDSSMSLSSVTGLPVGTGVTLVIDATNASGIATPALMEVATGVVSGSQIVNLVRGQDGTTAQAHSTGANVVMWVTANLWNDFQAAFLQNHGQLHGYHKSLTDQNGNPWIDQSAATNAVNRLQVANAATGGGVTLSAVGSDPNIPITISPKGTGTVILPNGVLSSLALTIPYKFFAYSSGYTASLGFQVVHFDAELYDTGSNFSTSTYTFTAPVAGFYHFDGNITVVATSAGQSVVQLQVVSAGVTTVYWGDAFETGSSGNFSSGVHLDVQLAAGDTVQMIALTASGQTVNGKLTGPTTYPTHLSGHLLSAT